MNTNENDVTYCPATEVLQTRARAAEIDALLAVTTEDASTSHRCASAMASSSPGSQEAFHGVSPPPERNTGCVYNKRSKNPRRPGKQDFVHQMLSRQLLMKMLSSLVVVSRQCQQRLWVAQPSQAPSPALHFQLPQSPPRTLATSSPQA